MKCQNCGYTIADITAKFCRKCGKPLEPVKKAETKGLMSFSDVWPEWTAEKQLGKGSYGTVYKAVRRDHNVESYSAIKVIAIPSDPSEIDSPRYHRSSEPVPEDTV